MSRSVSTGVAGLGLLKHLFLTVVSFLFIYFFTIPRTPVSRTFNTTADLSTLTAVKDGGPRVIRAERAKRLKVKSY